MVDATCSRRGTPTPYNPLFQEQLRQAQGALARLPDPIQSGYALMASSLDSQ